MPLVTEWQNRPLEKTYSFIFMDAIHYKVREDKQIIIKAAYVVLGVNMDTEKKKFLAYGLELTNQVSFGFLCLTTLKTEVWRKL